MRLPIALFLLLGLTNLSELIAAPEWPNTVKIGHKGVETALIQSLLNQANNNSQLSVDGDFGPGTKTAVISFQQSNGLSADGIVGPNTWKKLFQSRERYLITFEKGVSTPNNSATTENDSLYGSNVIVQTITQEGIKTAFKSRGSIMPDDMAVKGHLLPGFFVLHLGLHKRQGLTPTVADLIVKKTGTLRPSLIVNQDRNVPVKSNDPTKTKSNAIHIHNGFNTSRGSDGCLTITPSKWSAFIKHFLDKNTSLSDWSVKTGTSHSYRGKEIGFLIVK